MRRPWSLIPAAFGHKPMAINAPMNCPPAVHWYAGILRKSHSKTVGDLLKSAKVNFVRFIRYKVGELS